MKHGQHGHLVLIFAACTLLATSAVVKPAGAQGPEPWILFGHDNGTSTIITIDTTNGLARPIGPTGFYSTASGLEAASAQVPGPVGTVWQEGTIFGLLRDSTFNKDYVVAIKNETGVATKSVEVDLTISGRGIGFGPDGKTLYALIPPGELWIIDTVTGALTLIGEVMDATGAVYSGVSLGWDPDSESFLALAGPGTDTLIRIDPDDASATVIGQIADLSACTLTRSPGPVAGPGGSVFPEGTWFTINNQTNALHALSVDTQRGIILENREIGALGPNASNVCGTGFALPELPTPTPTATPTITPTPGPTATPGPTPDPSMPTCVCEIVYKRVPAVIIMDALANPERYYGWRYRLDEGKPPGPNNPPRECLSLLNRSLQYHPLWNTPIWRVGCQ